MKIRKKIVKIKKKMGGGVQVGGIGFAGGGGGGGVRVDVNGKVKFY